MQICILLIYLMEINMYSEREKNLNLDVLVNLRVVKLRNNQGLGG